MTKRDCAVSCELNEPMARHTSWRAGGARGARVPSRPISTICARSCARSRREEPVHRRRARQQPAGARRRPARHRDPHALGAARGRGSGDARQSGGEITPRPGVAEPQGRALRGAARSRRRGIPRRHTGHRRRRARDERRLLRRRDVGHRRRRDDDRPRGRAARAHARATTRSAIARALRCQQIASVAPASPMQRRVGPRRVVRLRALPRSPRGDGDRVARAR